jgi:hypothetical protein
MGRKLLTPLIVITAVLILISAFFNPIRMEVDITEVCANLRPVAAAASWVDRNCR